MGKAASKLLKTSRKDPHVDAVAQTIPTNHDILPEVPEISRLSILPTETKLKIMRYLVVLEHTVTTQTYFILRPRLLQLALVNHEMRNLVLEVFFKENTFEIFHPFFVPVVSAMGNHHIWHNPQQCSCPVWTFDLDPNNRKLTALIRTIEFNGDRAWTLCQSPNPPTLSQRGYTGVRTVKLRFGTAVMTKDLRTLLTVADLQLPTPTPTQLSILGQYGLTILAHLRP